MAIQVLDGGMGRQLKAMGAPFEQPEWSALALMQAPEYVSRAHRQFIDAGARIVTTNNYAVVPYHIGQERFDQQGHELITLSGKLCREEADSANANASAQVLVAGSLPPLFGSYRPEMFDQSKAAALYTPIVDALAPWVDLWLGETISSLDEFRAVRRSISAQPQDFWISFTLSDNPVDGRAVLRSEESIAEMLDVVLLSDGKAVAGVLFNCSQPELITLALRELQALQRQRDTALISGGYGNAFTPRGKTAEANSDIAPMRDELTVQHYADIAGEWLECGASVVGGCCGIGPEHIAEISQRYSAQG